MNGDKIEKSGRLHYDVIRGLKGGLTISLFVNILGDVWSL